MNDNDIKKMQEIASRKKSLEMINIRNKHIDAEMEKLKQQQAKEDKLLLAELPEEVREEVFMILQ